MNHAQKLHFDAMSKVDEAEIARRAKDHARAKTLFTEALELERAAAEAATTQPGRAILFRSAGWIALEAENPEEAERLAAKGLADVDVSDQRKEELRAVLEEARMRIFQPMAPPSAATRVVLHMEGPSVAHGRSAPEIIQKKENALLQLLYRTADRMQNESFRGQGVSKSKKEMHPQVEYLAASIAIQITLGGQAQQELWDQNQQIVQELQECLSLVSAQNFKELQRRIHDEAYRRDFQKHAKRLAPDGKDVTSVDIFSSSPTSSFSRIQLREPISFPARTKREQDSLILVGELRGLDETYVDDRIKLVSVDGATREVIVEEGTIDEFFSSMYGRTIRLEARVSGSNKYTMIGDPELVEDE